MSSLHDQIRARLHARQLCGLKKREPKSSRYAIRWAAHKQLAHVREVNLRVGRELLWIRDEFRRACTLLEQMRRHVENLTGEPCAILYQPGIPPERQVTPQSLGLANWQPTNGVKPS